MHAPALDGAAVGRPSTPSLRVLLSLTMWAAVVWVVVFWRLGGFSLIDPDEAHYAQLTREMLRTNRWLVPLLDGVPHLDKPVLFHWLQAAAITLVGETEFALRLPSACAALALIATIRWTGSQLFGRRIGIRSAVMFATLPFTFVLSSVGLFDMVFTAFLFGAVAFLLVASLRQRANLEYVGWPLLALAVLTKGPVALVLVVLLGIVLSLSTATRPVVTRLRWISGVIFVVLAAAPWFVYMWMAFPRQFVRDYALAGNLWYFTAPAQFTTRRGDPAFYLRTFTGAFFPWSLIAVGRGVDVIRLWRRGESLSIEERSLWTWLLVVMSFFTIAGFKLDTYIFPAAPAVAMLAAFGWQQASLPETPFGNRAWTRRAALAVALVLITAGAIVSAVLFRIDLGITAGAAMLPAVLVAGGVLVAVRLFGRHGILPRTPVATVATLVLIYVSVVLYGIPVLERSRPTAPLGRWVKEHSRPDAPLGVIGLSDWRASIRYYSDRRLVSLDGPDEVKAFLDRHPDGYVMMRRREYLALRDAGSEIRAIGGRPAIVDRSGRFIRRQIWGRILVAARADPLAPTLALADGELDLK